MEADIMILVGCDLHARDQQVAVLDTATGEIQEQRLTHDRPSVEQFYAALPDPAVRDQRTLVAHRMRLVRMRTMVKNGVHAIALNYRLALGPSLFTRAGVAQLQALSLPPHTSCRRSESLELLRWLDTHIKGLDDQIEEAAHAHPEAQRLMTHPGVGPLSALATVLVLGSVIRFH